MRKKITAGQAAFLLPLFLLLAVFAIYPIITSVVYSLFDYRPMIRRQQGSIRAEILTRLCLRRTVATSTGFSRTISRY